METVEVNRFILLALFLWAPLLAACSSADRSALAAELPEPRIRVTSRPASTTIPTSSSQTSASPLSKRPVPDSLEKLARQAYGTRLVEWIRIPKLNLLAPVKPVGWSPSGDSAEWDSPDAQVGWAVSSALPGDPGNIILYGHNNIDSSIFMRLSELKPGDRIQLTTGDKDWVYRVELVKILPVLSDAENQQAYADYFQKTSVAQLTLLSCWPPISNTHRVIVVALPFEEDKKQ
jgi:sortase A